MKRPLSFRLRNSTLALVLCCLASLVVVADPPPDTAMLTPFPHPKGHVCHRVETPITIDGDLFDAAWEAAPWTEAFVDIEGDKKPKPPLRTRVKMLWDDEALYLAAELEEPHVWATLTEHDSVIFHDNDFEVFLDPDGDTHVYAELELNAKNTTWDLLLTKPYKDGGNALNGWEIKGLKTAVKVKGTINDPRDKDVGWTLEIRWPWDGLKEVSSLKLPPKDGDQLRINFSRVQWDTEVVDGKYQKVKGKPEHNWVWSPQGVIDMHRPERWGYLQLTTAKPGKVEFRPDREWEVRDLLHRAYYSQRVYYKANGRYAAALGDLNLKDKGLGQLTLDGSKTWFEISAPATSEKGAKAERITISKDGLIRKE